MIDRPPHPASDPASQAFSVKRAEVEFHNFASLGEPEHAISVYEEENRRRGAVLRNHSGFIGGMTPFLEVGANAGHTSYLLSNDFGASGFALDLSADALRYGAALMDRWGMDRAPVRIAGDALRLPFADNSMRFVMTYQTLSQFMNIESVFLEVKRVLAPGGVFLFAEEPLLRLLSLRLYRAPYYNLMKPWERTLYDWGLLGFFVKDVIGASQEEGFGIRQNHTMYLSDWHRLVTRHFTAWEYDVFVPERGWGERWVKRLAVKLDPHGSEWRAARLLGGTLAAVCRKAGDLPKEFPPLDRFEAYLRCPDCGSPMRREQDETLRCSSCSYSAAVEGGVYNLLASKDRAELYPGDRADAADFSLPGHESRLGSEFYEVEGVFGGKYRWMGARSEAVLKRVAAVPLRLRIRGHAHELSFAKGAPVTFAVRVNGVDLGEKVLDRAGLFIYEADVADAEEYRIEMTAGPEWTAPPDDRVFTVHLGMIRLVPRDA